MAVTIKEAEQIRGTLGDDLYQFSLRIGYSTNAYRFAEARKTLSPRMAREIARRYKHLLKEE